MARVFAGGESWDQSLFSSTIGFTPDYPLTMACHAIDTDGANDDHCLMHIQDRSSGNSYFRFGKSDTNGGNDMGLRGFINNGSSSSQVNSATDSIVVDTWFHGCVVFAASNSRKVYVDGSLGGTDTTPTVTLPGGLDSIAIGREEDSSSSDSWIGSIAEAAVWLAELDAGEIAALAAGASPLLIRRDALVFYAPLYRGTADAGGTDFDYVGGLTLVNDGSNTVGVGAHPKIFNPVAPIVMQGTAAVGGAASQQYYYYENLMQGSHL